MAVGVIAVGLGIREPVGQQAQQARQAIGGAVHGVSQHGQGATQQAQQEFQQRHADVDGQRHQQHPLDLLAVVAGRVPHVALVQVVMQVVVQVVVLVVVSQTLSWPGRPPTATHAIGIPGRRTDPR